MKRVALLSALAAAVLLTAAGGAYSRVGSGSGAASTSACTLPNKQPVWIDFADGSVPFWQTFARPGVVAAAANFIFPPQLRARGAKTIYWDMHLPLRVGTPAEPASPAEVIDRANRIYDYASSSMDCPNPMIAENELNGASTITPWSKTNALYRADVLLYLRTLASRGARPALLVSSRPYTGGEAGDWWRQVAQVSDLVREIYFPAPILWKRGPIDGSRFLRQTFRQGVSDFVHLGMPRSRIGVMLGFQTARGFGGREGLRPRWRWFDTVKMQVLAAQEVARETKYGTIWSWGWGVWNDAEDDPDKPAAACVWLWARDPTLCNGPKAAGVNFDASRTEGQLIFPKGARCTLQGRNLPWADVSRMTSVVGDGQAAFTAAYARAVVRGYAKMTGKRTLEAERAVIALRFHGSRSAYMSALGRAHAGLTVAREVIADELRRAEIQKTLKVGGASADEIQSYYDNYSAAPARLVKATPAAPWLGNRKRGFALGTEAPSSLFDLARGHSATVQTMQGKYKVTALGPVLPLGQFPLAQVKGAIAAAIASMKRDEAYQGWLLERMQAAQKVTTCWRDQLPAVDAVTLTDYLPFLALDSGNTTNTGGRRNR